MMYRATYLQNQQPIKEVALDARDLMDAVRLLAVSEPPPSAADGMVIEPLKDSVYSG